MSRAGTAERVFLVPDIHCDDHDPKAVALAAQLCEAFKPTRIIFLGDAMDCGWASSKYKTDSRQREGACAREIAAWEGVLQAFHFAPIQCLLGNHERRVLDYLNDHPELRGTLGIEPSTIFPGLVEAGFVKLAAGSFVVTHGSTVRKWAGWSAKAEMDRWGCSGATGHTHRIASYYQRDASGVRVWVECGHLARNPPRYRAVNEPAPLNWMQGVVTVETEGNQFNVNAIPFTLHYRAMFNGRRYSA